MKSAELKINWSKEGRFTSLYLKDENGKIVIHDEYDAKRFIEAVELSKKRDKWATVATYHIRQKQDGIYEEIVVGTVFTDFNVNQIKDLFSIS